MGRLEGKTALITGGNSGIGLATAKRFVAEGAEVFITGRRQEELDKAVEAIGNGVKAVQGDVSNLDDLDRLFASVRAERGRIDILFANAGLGATAPIGAITEASFDLVFDVNVKGTLFTVQKALPLMQAGGSIILTGSTTGSMGTPAFSVYSATKAAIRNFARSWDSRERALARSDRYTGPSQRLGKIGTTGRADRGTDRPDTPRPHGPPGGDSRRGALPSLRRQQFHDRK
jgi:NAD(P)-dependent dehydrogenase (short-subunit alcohol dehydrogenase family)